MFAAVLQHIHAGNTLRLGSPRTSTPASRSGRRPPANWLPRRMDSLSSSSSVSASHSSGSMPVPSSTLRPVKREAVSSVCSPLRRRSRGIIINEPRVSAQSAPTGLLRLRQPKPEPADSTPTGLLRLRQPKPEPADSASAGEDAFAIKMATEQSMRDSAPQQLMESSSPDILAWSRADWKEQERLQEEAERQAWSGRALAYQGAPLFVLDDNEEGGPSYQPWRCGDAGQGSSRPPQPPSDDDDCSEDDGKADAGYTSFYDNLGM